MDGGMIQAIMGAGQAVKQQQLGMIQAGIGYFGGRKARKNLENLQSPVYTPAKSISDYYSEAKQRYNTSPYASTLYNTQVQNINKNVAQGIAGMQSKRLGIGGISSLIQGKNDSMLQAAAAAEQQRDQRFGQLGAASNAMAGEERQAFSINQMMPYERRYNMLAQKAQGYNQMFNAGIQNYFGGSQAASTYTGGATGMSGMQAASGAGSQNYYQDSDLKASTYRVPLAKY